MYLCSHFIRFSSDYKPIMNCKRTRYTSTGFNDGFPPKPYDSFFDQCNCRPNPLV